MTEVIQHLDAGVVSQAQHTQWDLVAHGRALAARVHILPLTPPTLVTSGTTEMGMIISSATPAMLLVLLAGLLPYGAVVVAGAPIEAVFWDGTLTSPQRAAGVMAASGGISGSPVGIKDSSGEIFLGELMKLASNIVGLPC